MWEGEEERVRKRSSWRRGEEREGERAREREEREKWGGREREKGRITHVYLSHRGNTLNM